MTEYADVPAVPENRPFSIARIMQLLLVATGIATIGLLAMMLMNAGFSDPVKVHGRITWKGKPVTVGAVMAQHLSDKMLAPIGSLDEDGRFELFHNMKPRIPVGDYKLRVASFDGGMGATPLVPKLYTDFATTPLRVRVAADPEKNFFEIELEGELPEAPQRPDSGEFGDGNRSAAPDGKNAEGKPEAGDGETGTADVGTAVTGPPVAETTDEDATAQ